MTRATSYSPILAAAGIMLTLWGAATTWAVSVAGVVVVGIGVFRWIREVRT